MGIGVGIALLIVGLALAFNVVEIDIPLVNEYRLGILLTIGGVVAIVLVMLLASMRRRSTHVIERERGE